MFAVLLRDQSGTPGQAVSQLCLTVKNEVQPAGVLPNTIHVKPLLDLAPCTLLQQDLPVKTQRDTGAIAVRTLKVLESLQDEYVSKKMVLTNDGLVEGRRRGALSWLCFRRSPPS